MSPFSKSWMPTINPRSLAGPRIVSADSVLNVPKFGANPDRARVKNIHASIAQPDPFKTEKIRRGGL